MERRHDHHLHRYGGKTLTAYYNEIEPYAARWLRNLISAGEIAPGEVDERDIRDVRPDELAGFTQCHFFAGIGIWSHALRSAGWDDDRPVWTGSCPCQPFSSAGGRKGTADERHLWPHWFHLIEQCRPETIYGEQVASKDGLAWLDLVQTDLEGTGHAFWPFDLCAASLGAPHIRQRLWFVASRLGNADREHTRRLGGTSFSEETESEGRGRELGTERHIPLSSGAAGSLGDPEPIRLQGRVSGRQDQERQTVDGPSGRDSTTIDMANTESGRQRELGSKMEPGQVRHADSRVSASGRMVNPDGGDTSTERQQPSGEHGQQQKDGRAIELADSSIGGRDIGTGLRGSRQTESGRYELADGISPEPEWPGPTNGFWRDADWLFCRDGKWRPARPGSFPLVDGNSFKLGSGSAYEGKSRQGMLRAYGNAINAEVATAFVSAYMEAIERAAGIA